MCRSSSEPGGPRRCPAHARARLAASIAEVENLELREAALYRAASAAASTATQRSYTFASQLRAAVERIRDLRQWAEEDGPEVIIDEYRDAYRDLLAARRDHATAQEPAAKALALMAHRRGQAQVALEKAGLSPQQADAYLDQIDRDTGYAPPF